MSADESISTLIRKIKSLLFIQNEDDLSFLSTSIFSAVKNFIELNCNRIDYGNPKLKNLFVYEIGDTNGFDPSYLAHIQAIRLARKSGQNHLSELIENVLTPQIKPTDDEEEMAVPDDPNTKQYIPTPLKRAKIVDYFKFVPKEHSLLAIATGSQYFMPMQLRPNTFVKIANTNLNRNPAGYLAKCWQDLERFSIMKLKLLQFGDDYRPPYFGI
jgi:hypothetical protein